MDSEKKMEMRI